MRCGQRWPEDGKQDGILGFSASLRETGMERRWLVSQVVKADGGHSLYRWWSIVLLSVFVLVAA